MIELLRVNKDVRRAMAMANVVSGSLVIASVWEDDEEKREYLRARSHIMKQHRVMPHRSTITRCVVRMDLATMDMRRRWWMDAPPCSLTLAYDASPQHGVEMFNTFIMCVGYLEPSLERARECFDADAPFADPSVWDGLPVRQRILPCQVLGCGRMSVPDKLAALLNQVYLEFGPSAVSMRRALASVVCALSDMGAELAIAGTGDCVDAFLQTGDVGCPQSSGARESFAGNTGAGFLFPRAMQVPGPINIVDLVLRTTVGQGEWWSGWQVLAKDMLQWFHLATIAMR